MAKSKTKKSLPVKPTSKQTNTKKQPKVSFIKKLFPPQYFTKDIAEYGKMTRKPVLFVRNLTKKYSRRKAPAIENVNINVYPGEFHAFIGANGAGKTTTLKSIIGGYVNWSGTILINGINSNKEAAKAKLGYIPETPRFPAQFSAFQYLEIMMELSGVSPKDAKIRTEKELKSMNLWRLKNKSPNTFSSGQKKKMLLAQALIHDPNIILMDEPVANLDPQARNEFFVVLNKLRHRGVSVLISSHVLAELDIYFDSVTIIDGGHTVFDGSKAQMQEAMKTTTHYVIKTNKDATIKRFFHKNKIKYTIDKENKTIKASLPKQSDILKVITFISKNKILIERFIKEQVSLDAVYKKMIIKGSVDTMTRKEKK